MYFNNPGVFGRPVLAKLLPFNCDVLEGEKLNCGLWLSFKTSQRRKQQVKCSSAMHEGRGIPLLPHDLTAELHCHVPTQFHD